MMNVRYYKIETTLSAIAQRTRWKEQQNMYCPFCFQHDALWKCSDVRVREYSIDFAPIKEIFFDCTDFQTQSQWMFQRANNVCQDMIGKDDNRTTFLCSSSCKRGQSSRVSASEKFIII